MDHKKIRISFFIILLIIAVVGVGLLFLPYMGPLIFAAILAVVFQPLYTQLLRHAFFKRRPSLASILVVLTVTVIIILPLSILTLLLITETSDLYTKVASNSDIYKIISDVQVYILGKVGNFPIDLGAAVKDYTKNLFSFIVKHIGSLFADVMGLIFSFFLTLFALYYLIKDGHKLNDILVNFSPLTIKDDKQIVDSLKIAFNSVIKGTILIALLQGLLEGIGLFIFGVPNPVLFGFMAVIASVIPMLGTIVITIPATIYLLLTGHTVAAVGILLWGVLLVGLIDNFVRPKLIENDTNLHPLLIFISIIGGLKLFGVLGFIFGPILLSLLFALLDIYKKTFKIYIEEGR